VAHRDDATGLGDAPHLSERVDRIGEVLQHLVRVHDVERVVVEVERVDVGGVELDVGRTVGAGGCGSALHDLGRGIHPYDTAWCHVAGKVQGDTSGTCAHVKNRRTGRQIRLEVR